MENHGGAIEAAIKQHGEEITKLRLRYHEQANDLFGVRTNTEVIRTEVDDLKGDMERIEKLLESQHREINGRFDKLTGQAWKVAGFVISVMLLAAAVISLVVQ